MTISTLDELTPRERQVLHCLAAGKSNRQIANQLIITVATVQNHLHNIYDKLDVPNRTAAVVVAIRRGLVQAGK